MKTNNPIGWTQTPKESPFIGEVKKRRASAQGMVALGPKWRDRKVVVIENEDGSVTVREA